MAEINLSPPSVDFWEVYIKLSHSYFDKVEKMIATRLPHTILVKRENFEGAEEVINRILIDRVKELKDIIPGAGIFLDDRLNITPTYREYPIVVVDVVDGSAELKGGGTEVASTLAIVMNDGTIPLSVISYPFGRERSVDVNKNVYRIPNDVLDEIDTNRNLIEKYKLSPKKSRSSFKELRISERYEFFDDNIRTRLDEMRTFLDVSIKRPLGSLSKNLMSIVTGSCDIYMVKGKDKHHFYDTVAAGKIITDLEGIFRDLNGNERTGFESMNGIIAASTSENYSMFCDFLMSKK